MAVEEMNIKIIKEKITQEELKKYCDAWFEDMVKIVIDVEQEKIAIGGELHADAEKIMIENGSGQEYRWGANIYPFNSSNDRIEFTAMVNIKPHLDNPSMEILDENIKCKIQELVEKYIINADEKLV